MDTRKTIKQILREDVTKNKPTKLAVFDFDGTLAYSPEPEIGKPKYKEVTGQDWPHKGWWGRAESLDTNIFDIPVNPSVVSDYKKEKSNPDTLVIMMTGRIPKLSKEVEDILSANNLSFDYYLYNNESSTLDFKINTMDRLLSKYPTITEVEMWDDRDEHIGPFQAWGSTLNNIDFHINHVK
jgi:hypothetical protein